MGKLLMCILPLFVILSCIDTQDAFYNNIDEAIKHGVVEKGWIPNILPRSSYEIHERHDLDTNTVWLRFKFDKSDINELIIQIQEIKPNEIKTVAFPSPNISWWPSELNSNSFSKEKTGLKLYKFNHLLQYANGKQRIAPAFFAIDWSSNTAYYWQYSN